MQKIEDITVVISGGLVRLVIIDGKTYSATVHDYDIDGVLDPELSEDNNGFQYLTYTSG